VTGNLLFPQSVPEGDEYEAGSDCSHISGLCKGARCAPGHEGIRARGANQCERPRWASEVIGFPSRRSDPICHLLVLSEQSSVSLAVRRSPQAAAVVYARPVFHTAHAIRASLLAKATAALLWPRVRSSCRAHARSRSGAGAVLVLA
jgi:hypothetical protein